MDDGSRSGKMNWEGGGVVRDERGSGCGNGDKRDGGGG